MQQQKFEHLTQNLTLFNRPALMSSLLSLLWICFFTGALSHKIAIVGGGLGGAANAHFLKELLGNSGEIKVI